MDIESELTLETSFKLKAIKDLEEEGMCRSREFIKNMKIATIELDSPLDMHLHLREGEMLKNMARFTSKDFSGAIIMPNLSTPVTTKELVLEYRQNIINSIGDDKFEPLMTVFYDSKFDVKALEEIKDIITAVKYYPMGITTNSEGGLASIDIDSMRDVLEKLEEYNIPLLFHGETNGFVFDREYQFLPIWESLAKEFPKLKIMMEHISDRRTLELLDKYENLYATVTAHHLLFTIDDVIGGMLEPHLFCKPIIKSHTDRDAIQKAVLSGDPKIMFGSDSAPHLKTNKEKAGGSAGIFTAPVTLSLLTDFFEKNGKVHLMQNFISGNAKKIYNLKNIPDKTITITRESWVVPDEYNGVVPIFAGKTLNWKVV